MIVKEHINLDPFRRSSANFIILARLDREDGELSWEQLWAPQLNDELFKICCIPFFVYGLSLDDTVRAPLDGGRYVFADIVEKSGHRTFRASLRSSPGEEERERIRMELIAAVRSLQGSVEFYSGTLVGIDAPTEQSYYGLCNELEKRKGVGQLDYEESD